MEGVLHDSGGEWGLGEQVGGGWGVGVEGHQDAGRWGPLRVSGTGDRKVGIGAAAEMGKHAWVERGP